jgi:hypothetical protein
MADEQKPGLLVEDVTVAGGTDKVTGAPVIRPKSAAGQVDESTRATDKREGGCCKGRKDCSK